MIVETPKNNIINLSLPDRGNKSPTFKLIDKPHKSYSCKHMNCDVDEHLRTVTCKHCGKNIDPFDWILTVAKAEKMAYISALSVDAETKRRRKAIEEMKRVETNYKSRIKNAKNKLNDPLFDNIESAIKTLSRYTKNKMEVEYFIRHLKKITSS